MITPAIAAAINNTHALLRRVTDDLTDEQMARQANAFAPSIAWHLWHVTRWTDRLHATFAPGSDHGAGAPLPAERWVAGGLASRWGLEPAKLGVLETGTGMAAEDLAPLAKVEPGIIKTYARECFERLDRRLEQLDEAQLGQARAGVKAFRAADGVVAPAPAAETTVLADLLFHLAHGSRHLGMIEALRGALLQMRGTASV